MALLSDVSMVNKTNVISTIVDREELKVKSEVNKTNVISTIVDNWKYLRKIAVNKTK